MQQLARFITSGTAESVGDDEPDKEQRHAGNQRNQADGLADFFAVLFRTHGGPPGSDLRTRLIDGAVALIELITVEAFGFAMVLAGRCKRLSGAGEMPLNRRDVRAIRQSIEQSESEAEADFSEGGWSGQPGDRLPGTSPGADAGIRAYAAPGPPGAGTWPPQNPLGL